MATNLSILQVNTRELGGGAEGSAVNLFQKYRELGHKSWLAVGWKSGNDPDVIEFPKAAPMIVPEYNRNILGDRLLQWFDGIVQTKMGSKFYLNDLTKGAPEIRRIIQHESGLEDFNFPGTWHLLDLPPLRPNIIHLHNLHGHYFDLRYLPKLSHLIPVILNLRDMWTLTGHCALSINCDRWKIGCGHCPDLKIYPSITRDATRFNYKRKKNIFLNSKLFITTPTKWLMDQVLSSQMFEAVEYRVIPNGIDTQLFQPGDKKSAREVLGLPQDAQIILFLAHNIFKDYATLRAALGYLKKKQAPLLFICIGLEGEKERVGEGEIIYTGLIRDDKKMVSYYQASDIYIHAAHHEVFGKSIVEAMACAKPVVATGIDGIPEIVTDGVNGFLTPAKEPAELAKPVNFLLENPILKEQIGADASNYAKKAFNLDRQVNDFLSWYQEILEKQTVIKK